MAIASLHNLSVYESRSPIPNTRASSILQMWRNLEGEQHMMSHHNNRLTVQKPRELEIEIESETSYSDHDNNLIESENEHSDTNSSSSEQSYDVGEIERERVRDIFRAWMKRNSPNNTSNVYQIRPIRKFCGRQTLVDLLKKAQIQRNKELDTLLDCKHVSNFPHRNRIQSLLRGRFLLTRRLIQDERPSSIAASELDSLSQRNSVSDLREGFLSRLDTNVQVVEEIEINVQKEESLINNVDESFEEVLTEEEEESDMEEIINDEINEWREVYEGEIWEESIVNVNDIIEEEEESNEYFHGNVLQEAIDSWLDVPSEQESFRRIDSFDYSRDENNQSTELRELVNRRPVSTLLGSGFRESLDQLIQSYIERQNLASIDWEVDEEESVDQEDSQPSWDPLPLQRVENECDIFNELKFDMARLEEKMSNMQRGIEECMDMQLELQRSFQQEVSAALNRKVNSTDDDTKWEHVRKGICCMCKESNIDTLLYRCGHICTCANCGDKLVKSGKCPMCCAPVIEVVRAYFIQS